MCGKGAPPMRMSLAQSASGPEQTHFKFFGFENISQFIYSLLSQSGTCWSKSYSCGNLCSSKYIEQKKYTNTRKGCERDAKYDEWRDDSLHDGLSEDFLIEEKVLLTSNVEFGIPNTIPFNKNKKPFIKDVCLSKKNSYTKTKSANKLINVLTFSIFTKCD